MPKQPPGIGKLPRGAHEYQVELKPMKEVLGLGHRDMWWTLKFGFTFSAIPEGFRYSSHNICDYPNPSHLTALPPSCLQLLSINDASCPHSGHYPCLSLQLPREVSGPASAPAPWSVSGLSNCGQSSLSLLTALGGPGSHLPIVAT